MCAECLHEPRRAGNNSSRGTIDRGKQLQQNSEGRVGVGVRKKHGASLVVIRALSPIATGLGVGEEGNV